MRPVSFVTDSGVVVPAVTTEQMREVDRLAIEEGGPNLFQMMENAGRSLAMTVIETLGVGWKSSPVVVLAGTGGNGGGGICAARHLANRGADVTVVVSDPAGLKVVPMEQLIIYQGTSGKAASVDELSGIDAAIVVDAIVGYSLRGPASGAVKSMIDWTTAQAAQVVALDVPSGVDATTGSSSGAHVQASLTMTLALPKTGLAVPASGALCLADIGIPRRVYDRAGIETPLDVFGTRYVVPIRAIGD